MKSLTLRSRLFLALLALALVPLVGASLWALATTSGALRDKVGTYSQQLVGQIALNLEGQLAQIKGLTDEILIAPEVSGRLVGYPQARESDRVTRFVFGKLLELQFLNVDHVEDVLLVLGSVGGPTEVIETSPRSGWAPTVLGWLARPGQTPGLSVIDTPGQGRGVVLVRPVRSALVEQTLGHLVVVLDPEFLARVYRGVDVGPGSDLFVVDAQGVVVSGRHPGRPLGQSALPAGWIAPGDQPRLRLWEGQEHLFSTAPVGQTGWTMVAAVPSSYLDSEAAGMASQVLVFSLVALVLALGVSFQIARSFTAPLLNLEKTMALFGEGMIQARSVVGTDEVGRLQRTFNAMAADITDLVARIGEEHRRRRLSELQVLEYQINPHFLYNTLDSINWMARRAHQDDISEAVTALARFFRLSLSRGQEVYRVRDEVDHVRAYLAISQMRYPDSFRCEIVVDETLLDRRTLKIVLQPLVENAIRHGINKKARGGALHVSARDVGALEWTVTDNGRGMTPETLAALQARLADPEPSQGPEANDAPSAGFEPRGGFGLVNVCQRIRLNYGPNYGLWVTSRVGEGTTVRVLVPWEPEAGPGESKNSNEKTKLQTLPV